MSQVVSLELRDEVYTALRQQAESIGISISELILIALERQSGLTSSKKRRQSGSAKGLIFIAPDFDQPIEDFGEYMG